MRNEQLTTEDQADRLGRRLFATRCPSSRCSATLPRWMGAGVLLEGLCAGPSSRTGPARWSDARRTGVETPPSRRPSTCPCVERLVAALSSWLRAAAAAQSSGHQATPVHAAMTDALICRCRGSVARQRPETGPRAGPRRRGAQCFWPDTPIRKRDVCLCQPEMAGQRTGLMVSQPAAGPAAAAAGPAEGAQQPSQCR